MPQNAKRSTRAKKVKQLSKALTFATRRVKGHGIYVEDKITNKQPGTVNRMARMAGEALGSAIPLIPGIGKLIPAPLVSAASSALGDAGSWIARAFGFGRYTIRKNSLMKPMVRGGPGGARVEDMPYVAAPPQFSNGEGSDIIITHREFVGNVKSSVGFRTTTYPINPGNPVMYPFFSQIAALYEEFDIMGQLMEYRSTSATAVGTTSSAMGVVLMATDYDCYDENFTSKRQMEAAEFSSAAVPYETFIHPIECDRSRNVLSQQYIVPGITSADQAPGDQRLSVLGNFVIATEGQQTDNTDIGELWVTYHIRVSRPCLQSYAPTAALYASRGSGGVSNSGVVFISSQTVTRGLGGFGWLSTGVGNSSRLEINNSGNKVRGLFQIWTLTRSFGSNTPVEPADHKTITTGDVTTQEMIATQTRSWACFKESLNAAEGPTAYIQVYTTWVNWKGTGTVSIPVLHGADINSTFDIIISQVGDFRQQLSGLKTFVDDTLLNVIEQTYESPASSSTYQPGAVTTVAASAAKPALVTPIPVAQHVMVRR